MCTLESKASPWPVLSKLPFRAMTAERAETVQGPKCCVSVVNTGIALAVSMHQHAASRLQKPFTPGI